MAKTDGVRVSRSGMSSPASADIGVLQSRTAGAAKSAEGASGERGFEPAESAGSGPAGGGKAESAGKALSATQRKALARLERDRLARARAAAAKPEDMVDYELPEVELVRKGLKKELVGLSIKHVEAASMKCLRTYFFRKYFTSRLVGARIEDVGRIGLYVTLELDTGSLVVMSLGASGSPRWLASHSDRLDDTEVSIYFAEEGKLCFVDPVGTGQLFLVPADDAATHLPEIANYMQDPLDPIAWTKMGQRLLQKGGELKKLLIDNEFMVGIGEMYADEILFSAGLRYDRTVRTLSGQEIRRLHRSLVNTLFDAMKYGGTSVPSRPFLNPAGNEGAYEKHLKVWGRHDQLSERSGVPIRRTMYRGVWTYYCDTQI